MTLKFLTADDGEWDEVLASAPHDFYHLRAYSPDGPV